MTSPEQFPSRVRVVTTTEFYGTPEAASNFAAGMEVAAQELSGSLAHTTTLIESISVQDLLNDSLLPLLNSVSPSYRSIAATALSNQGIRYVRDPLVLGEAGLSKLDGVEDSTISSIRVGLGGMCLPFQFQVAPPVEYIATMCDHLGQVVVQVISPPYLPRRTDQAYGGPRRITVQDALDLTLLFRTLISDDGAVHQKAVAFAERFQSAKERLGAS